MVNGSDVSRSDLVLRSRYNMSYPTLHYLAIHRALYTEAKFQALFVEPMIGFVTLNEHISRDVSKWWGSTAAQLQSPVYA